MHQKESSKDLCQPIHRHHPTLSPPPTLRGQRLASAPPPEADATRPWPGASVRWATKRNPHNERVTRIVATHGADKSWTKAHLLPRCLVGKIRKSNGYHGMRLTNQVKLRPENGLLQIEEKIPLGNRHFRVFLRFPGVPHGMVMENSRFKRRWWVSVAIFVLGCSPIHSPPG